MRTRFEGPVATDFLLRSLGVNVGTGVRVIGIDELFASLTSFAISWTMALISFPSARIDAYGGMSRKS